MGANMLEEKQEETVVEETPEQEYTVDESGDIYFEDETSDTESEEKVEDDASDTAEQGQTDDGGKVEETMFSEDGTSTQPDYEKLLKMYEDSQSFIKKQSNEVGELRKLVEGLGKPKEKTQDEILNEMSLSEYDATIQSLEMKLNEPDADLDDNYRQDLLLYNKLLAKRSVKEAQSIYNTKENDKYNIEQLSKFKEQYSDLSDEEIAGIAELAKRYSDNGKFSKHNLDVAMHAKYPDKYDAYTRIKTEQTTREKIAKAADEINPTISSSGKNRSTKSIKLDEKLATTNPEKFQKLFMKLPEAKRHEMLRKWSNSAG